MKDKCTIKTRLYFLAFIFLAVSLTPQQSYAQFWKKIFGNHKKEHRENEDSNASRTRENAISKKVLPVYPPTIKKERYRVDVLLPIAIDKYAVQGRRTAAPIPASLQPVINFYEGVRLSANRLNAEGIKVDLYVQDVGEDGKLIPALVSNGKLRNSDVIIGYLQSEQLAPVARFAALNHITFLSAFSPSDAGISENPYFVMMQPRLETHILTMVGFAAKHYPGIRPLLLYADESAVQKESKHIFEQALKVRAWDSLSCTSFLSNPGAIGKFLDSQQVNVIMVNLLSYQEAASVLKKLKTKAHNYKLVVVGMPTWKYLPGLNERKTYSNLEIYFSSPFYFDLQSARGSDFVKVYQTIFGGKPSEMAFRGYETFYWTALLLNDFGTIFNSHIEDSRLSPFTRYNITPTWTPDNKYEFLENKNLYIFHYYNGLFNIVK